MPTLAPSIRRARGSDLPAVRRLLAGAGLPLDGVEESFDGFLVASREGVVLACIGLERFGGFGLLRSAAVRARSRGRGIGATLARRLIGAAEASGVREIYLLTTTAADYFPRFGFERVDRGEVPAPVRASAEFRGACPDSAVAMRLRLPAREKVTPPRRKPSSPRSSRRTGSRTPSPSR